MQINPFCENISSVEFSFGVEKVEFFAKKFLEFIIENKISDKFNNNFDYEFDILLCDNNFIQNVNKEYRNKNIPTDVITFAMYADSEKKIITDNKIALGQIIISLEKTTEQAFDNKNSIENEFLNLLAHGVLHLLGFDHEDDNKLIYMLELQSKMIAGILYV